ncbi:MAG: hypothetical protein LAO76_07700 [Acidobacteriia bacterium]|nr:hypothetical protein [Terriglobia bacterium]
MAMNRRRFIGQLAAALTYCSARGKDDGCGKPIGPATCNPPYPLKKVNVVFHGLFAFIIGPQNIKVITPDNPEHYYCCCSQGNYYEMKDEYTLDGIVTNNPPIDPGTIDKTKNTVLSAGDNRFTLDQVDQGKKSYCSITLPFPNASGMLPFRAISRPQIKFPDKYSQQIMAQTLPLIQSLTYDVADPTNVVLRPVDCRSRYQRLIAYPCSEIVNLHIFSEPECEVTQHHAEEAFNQMAALIHPNLADLTCTVVTQGLPTLDDPTNVPGLLPEDCTTLEERVEPGLCTDWYWSWFKIKHKRKEHNPTGGIQIANCMNLLVTP